jgi:hypothetical protein
MFKDVVKSATLTVVCGLLCLGSLGGIYGCWSYDRMLAAAALPEPQVVVDNLPEHIIFVPTDSDVSIGINMMNTSKEHILEPEELLGRARKTGEKVLCSPSMCCIVWALFGQGDVPVVYAASTSLQYSWPDGVTTDKLQYRQGAILAIPTKVDPPSLVCLTIGLLVLAILFGFGSYIGIILTRQT